MPTAVDCTSVFDAAVAAATRLKLTLTPLLFEVALAAMVPVLAIVMLSLPLPASMPVALDRTKVLVSLCARSIRLSLTLVLLTSDVAFAVKAPLLDIASLPAPPLMPTARVSSVVVAVTSSPPASVSDRVLLLDVAEAFTVSAPSLRRMSLPLPPSIPTAFTAPASEMSCGLESCDRLLEGDIGDRKSTRLNSSHANISYAVFCLKKKKDKHQSPGATPPWPSARQAAPLCVRRSVSWPQRRSKHSRSTCRRPRCRLLTRARTRSLA